LVLSERIEIFSFLPEGFEHGHLWGGGKRAFAPPLEIETKNENFLEKLKLAAQF